MAIIELSVYDIAKHEKHHAKILNYRMVEVDGNKYAFKCFYYLFTASHYAELERNTYENNKKI